jgi:hypothetical protein
LAARSGLSIFALADFTFAVFAPLGGLTFLDFTFAGFALATLWIFDFDLDLGTLTFFAMFVHSPIDRFCAEEQAACFPSNAMTRLPRHLETENRAIIRFSCYGLFPVQVAVHVFTGEYTFSLAFEMCRLLNARMPTTFFICGVTPMVTVPLA